MLSSNSTILETPAVSVRKQQSRCGAVNDRVLGLAVCSLGSAPHSTHALLCEETGDLMGEWTDGDPTFRVPVDGSTTMFRACPLNFGDAA
ncbi:hypothetical protein CH292_28355 [Rhodococcus sp. 14-2470-1a]|nr:hypothetical protein CH292_27630 [Rhodococcus sp. 14-2470-1a]OZF41410.1 hypothetical protein CH292_28355 [Rhodococcus sp. 14-2470-1a]